MEIVISTQNKTSVNFAATGLEDIIQCLETLLSTYKGTVFLDRGLGVNPDIIDEPLNTLGRLYQEIYFMVEEYEPRVEVEDIKVKSDHLNGIAEIKLKVNIDEDYL